MRISILGVPVDCVSQEEALRMILGFLRDGGQHHIATPNPEMIVEAQRNLDFRMVLQQTSLNIPDGIGLVWAMKRALDRKNEQHALARVTGTDMLPEICRAARGERMFLLGAAEGVAQRAADVLQRIYPSLSIVGTFAGSPNEEEERTIVERINTVSPSMLFVAYGAPAQDLWIARNLKRMPTINVAMGVGGAFDFLTGKQKRAPHIMQSIGFEWLWRLLQEPRRFRRIWRAVVVFPWIVLWNNRVTE